MAKKEKFPVPKGFKDLIQSRMKEERLSLRLVASEAGISASYLSRILSGERGLPKEEEIIRLPRALRIDPPKALLIEAGRVPKEMTMLLRATSNLTEKELKKLQKEAEMLLDKRRKGKTKRQ